MTTLSPPENFDRKVLDRALEKTKVNMFTLGKGMPWIWDLISNHDYIWSTLNHTAWVDGITIGINPAYFMGLPPASKVTLLAHLADHTMRDHFGRRGERDPQIWGWAGDYVINLELEAQGFTFAGMRDILIDYRYDNMATEQVYDLLMKDPIECARIAAMTFPSNMQSRDSVNYDPGSDAIPDLSGDLFIPPEGAQARIVQKILHAKEMAISSGLADGLPNEVRATIEGYENPRLPWHQILARFFTALGDEDYTWERPNRRYQDEFMPSLEGREGLDNLLYFFDVSGSVTEGQIKTAIGELRNMHRSIRPEEVSLILFDDCIQHRFNFLRDEDIGALEINGGGSTSLKEVYDEIVKVKPAAAVIFSDMLVQMMPNPGVPVVWICLDNRAWQPPNYGQVIHVDTEDLNV